MTTHRIAVAGIAGGVGATVTTAALALRLARHGYTVETDAHDVDQLGATFGHGTTPTDGAELAPGITYRDDTPSGADVTVLDVGTLSAMSATGSHATSWRMAWRMADVRLLVARPAYLGLRAAFVLWHDLVALATGLVVVELDGASLGGADIAAVLEKPVLATIPCRARIARVVDAGVLAARLPAEFERLDRAAGVTMDHPWHAAS